MSTNIYMRREDRKSLIFEIILKTAKEKGIFKFTVNDIAESSKCSIQTVKRYHGGILGIRESIIKYGKDKNIKWIKNTSIMEILND